MTFPLRLDGGSMLITSPADAATRRSKTSRWRPWPLSASATVPWNVKRPPAELSFLLKVRLPAPSSGASNSREEGLEEGLEGLEERNDGMLAGRPASAPVAIFTW
eukprot:CAMPEP_0170629344 /NCGR_PEP_ID=MMETSP0224-20130122/33298_1 /TAXON_ID=285029 /ORGANISM="Togula jolla, Strain CCCM 725" /LENGTH=104 /DNA_ID=CAMNT_0010957091 /DNA_START=179 /DNA_END=493 /DNA_ORIENTATION=+